MPLSLQNEQRGATRRAVSRRSLRAGHTAWQRDRRGARQHSTALMVLWRVPSPPAQDNLIPDWRLLRTTLLWNWVMLASGMVHSYTQHALVMTRCVLASQRASYCTAARPRSQPA